MSNEVYAIVNVQTGKLWRNKTYSTYGAADMALESLDLEIPRIAPLYDVFALTAEGWKEADHYSRDADIARILRTDYNGAKLAIA